MTSSPLVRVRVRVLKISTRVGLEYSAGLEYYITGLYGLGRQTVGTIRVTNLNQSFSLLNYISRKNME